MTSNQFVIKCAGLPLGTYFPMGTAAEKMFFILKKVLLHNDEVSSKKQYKNKKKYLKTCNIANRTEGSAATLLWQQKHRLCDPPK